MSRIRFQRRIKAGPVSGEAPPPEYEGPLDLVPGAVVAYDQRAASAAKVGTALYTLLRDTDEVTDTFESNASGDSPEADIDTFIGDPFTHLGNVAESVDITLADSYTDVAIGQALSGNHIPVNSRVTVIASLPVISISQACTSTESDVVITFTPDGVLQSWEDQSANGYDSAVQMFSVPFIDLSGDIPCFGAGDSSEGNIEAGDVHFNAGARTFCLVFDYTQGGNVVLLSTTDNVTPAYFEIGTEYNAENDVYVSVVAVDESTAYWATSTLLTTGRHCLQAKIAANGAVSIEIDGDDAGATLQEGVMAAAPETTATLQISTVRDRYKVYCAYAWELANADAAIPNVMTYYGIS